MGLSSSMDQRDCQAFLGSAVVRKLLGPLKRRSGTPRATDTFHRSDNKK